jgi:hypothetical protein
MLPTIVTILIVAAIVSAAVFFQRAQYKRELAKRSAIDQLLAAIDQRRLDITDLNQAARNAGLTPHEKSEVAVRVYGTYFRYALDDPVKWQELGGIATKLRLSAGDVDDVEDPIRIERYSQAWFKIAGSALPTSAALESFCAYQKKLGITDLLAARSFGPRAELLYQSAFHQSLQPSSTITAVYLGRLRDALGLDEKSAAEFVKQDAIDHVAAQCDSLLATGTLAIQDRERLSEQMRRLKVETTDIPDRWKKLERAFQLQSLRDGKLPKVDVTIALHQDETCHFHVACTFFWKPTHVDARITNADVYLTNERLVLASNEPGQSFEMNLAEIVDVEKTSDGVKIRSTASKGTGTYEVPDPELFEATLAGAMRPKTSVAAAAPSAVPAASGTFRSRAIPAAVKEEVWARDNGRCAECGAAEDLHYDHEIPLSKGGANTAQNIRLLCTRCGEKT